MLGGLGVPPWALAWWQHKVKLGRMTSQLSRAPPLTDKRSSTPPTPELVETLLCNIHNSTTIMMAATLLSTSHVPGISHCQY